MISRVRVTWCTCNRNGSFVLHTEPALANICPGLEPGGWCFVITEIYHLCIWHPSFAIDVEFIRLLYLSGVFLMRNRAKAVHIALP